MNYPRLITQIKNSRSQASLEVATPTFLSLLKQTLRASSLSKLTSRLNWTSVDLDSFSVQHDSRLPYPVYCIDLHLSDRFYDEIASTTLSLDAQTHLLFLEWSHAVRGLPHSLKADSFAVSHITESPSHVVTLEKQNNLYSFIHPYTHHQYSLREAQDFYTEQIDQFIAYNSSRLEESLFLSELYPVSNEVKHSKRL